MWKIIALFFIALISLIASGVWCLAKTKDEIDCWRGDEDWVRGIIGGLFMGGCILEISYTLLEFWTKGE
jgi:hypothetical protein